AKDNLQAVIRFFEKFPELASHDFYISGESYAGTYIPLLANEIIEYNKEASKKILLRGLMIGNGCTDYTECTIEAKRF
ncbi:S10 family peptidase, partial [Yangia sp. PrR004]|nr:S10 family peptidase [Salipiger sp. PrR004]